MDYFKDCKTKSDVIKRMFLLTSNKTVSPEEIKARYDLCIKESQKYEG